MAAWVTILVAAGEGLDIWADPVWPRLVKRKLQDVGDGFLAKGD